MCTVSCHMIHRFGSEVFHKLTDVTVSVDNEQFSRIICLIHLSDPFVTLLSENIIRQIILFT